MAGYSRQSLADIISGAVIKAAPVNAEFNAVRDAFAFSGGHKHDGSSTEGAYIPLIADVDALNKIAVDTNNNRFGVFVEVSSAAVEQVRFQDGVIVPVTDNDIDLGTSALEFKDLYLDGTAKIDTLTVDENATITGNLTVNGNTTLGNSATDTVTVTADISSNLIPDADSTRTLGDATNYWSHGYIDAVTTTGNAIIGGTLAVTGNTTVANLTATGTTTITSGDINSGAMDGTTIGASTPAAGTFTNLTANTSLTAATADINGGTVDNATIGATTPSTGAFTTISTSGQATLASADINGGAIDGTTIGASSHTTGKFTTLQSTGQATLATVDINGGTIDGTAIGSTTASSGAFTTVSATGGITGDLTGDVTGNVTGNVTGAITGNVTGNLTGNVTSSGTSTFNNVTIDGTLNMNAGTTATITNLTDPTNAQDAATKAYVDSEVSALVDSAPGTLDTLNELAAALGDDADFSTTVTNSIATKLPLAGGTMTGAIAMSTNKITGAGDPTAAQDVATKAYTDTQRDTRVAKAGDTMSGALAMGNNKITGLATPTATTDATNKTYVDGILGSATAAADSAAAAATSESNAATSETNAANSASAASTSETNAAASYDSFDDRYLGAKSTAPTVDNDGDALIIGALYFNSTTNIMYVYSSAGWQAAGSSVNGTSDRVTYTATSGQTVFAATYDAGYVDVYLNGVKLVAGTDFTATNGTSITLATGAAVNDIVDIVAYGTFVLADHYTEAQSDARYVNVTGDTMTGNLDVQGTVTADGLTVDGATGEFRGSGANTTYFTGGDDSIAGRQLTLSSEANGGQNNATHRLTVPSGYGSFNVSVNSAERLKIDNNGDISFYEDTGTTPKFFWDASAESLGIGTSSMFESLRVFGPRQNTSVGYDTVVNFISSDAFASGAGAGLSLGGKFNTAGSFTAFAEVAGIKENATDGNYAGALVLKTRTHGVSNITERLRIDSSGNLLVGTTDNTLYNNTSGSGIMLAASGRIDVARVQDVCAVLNRTGVSDGSIIDFSKNGSTVGSIGTNGNLYIQGPTGTSGVEFANNAARPWKDGARVDATVDLGVSGGRFKDIYLSGGVYLGGTGAANKLDDYEEGTFNPHIYDDSNNAQRISFTGQGRYIKIGNVLSFSAQCFGNGIASTTFTGKPYIQLPFNVEQSGGTIAYIGYYAGIGNADQAYVLGGGVNQIRFATTVTNPYNNQVSNGEVWGGNMRIYFSGTVVLDV